jgi:hypothetical protein
MPDLRPYVVPGASIRAAAALLQRSAVIAQHAGSQGIPYRFACALFEKESGGRNAWGGDEGGVGSRFERPVTREAFLLFLHEVTVQGRTSNGIGPSQITYAGTLREDGTRSGGYFMLMEQRGLRPWDPSDNIGFGLEILAANFIAASRTLPQRLAWRESFRAYNGTGPKAEAYADDAMRRALIWADVFEGAA